MMPSHRAELYSALAEVLAEPPEWLALPGHEWPLYEAAASLAASSSKAAEVLASVGQIPPESPGDRRSRYEALFVGSRRPRFWLYESMHLSGRLFGPQLQMVERLYQAAGLSVSSAELPDHASLELAFLAHLAEQQAADPVNVSAWRQLEIRFIKQHAGRWLPDVGRALAASGDVVYRPIGQLLADWLPDAAESLSRSRATAGPSKVPAIDQPACTLCGFCVQVCPKRALAIRENADETVLLLAVESCIGCAKCEHICATQALSMQAAPASGNSTQGWAVLRRSERAVCPGCGEATISQAELDYVAARVGHPTWLDYCLKCRAFLVEEMQ